MDYREKDVLQNKDPKEHLCSNNFTFLIVFFINHLSPTISIILLDFIDFRFLQFIEFRFKVHFIAIQVFITML